MHDGWHTVQASSHCGVVNKLKLAFLVAIILLRILIYASTRR